MSKVDDKPPRRPSPAALQVLRAAASDPDHVVRGIKGRQRSSRAATLRRLTADGLLDFVANPWNPPAEYWRLTEAGLAVVRRAREEDRIYEIANALDYEDHADPEHIVVVGSNLVTLAHRVCRDHATPCEGVLTDGVILEIARQVGPVGEMHDGVTVEMLSGRELLVFVTKVMDQARTQVQAPGAGDEEPLSPP